ncbi:unnamed protein product, partial [marine sediment metagenome]
MVIGSVFFFINRATQDEIRRFVEYVAQMRAERMEIDEDRRRGSGGSGGRDRVQPIIAIDMTKSADPTVVHDGDTVTYTYTMANTGNTPLSNVSISDDVIGNITYATGYQSGDANGDNQLDVNETWIFEGTYNVTSSDETPLENTAIAYGINGQGKTVESEQATASVDILRPGINMTKEATPSQVHDGDTVTYTYT